MKGDKFMDSMNHIDENLISQAEKLRLKESKRKKNLRIKIVAAAACLCLILTAVIVVPDYMSNPSGINNGSLFVGMNSYLITGAVYPKKVGYPSNPEDSDAYDKWFDARREMRELTETHRTDGVEFFKKTVSEFLKSDSENAIYSPLNVYIALCVLAETSDGESRQQILDLLGAKSVEEIRASANALWQIEYKDDSTGKCLLANSLWLNDSVQFNKSTLQTVADNYYASSFKGDMTDKDFNKARQNWINKQTDGILEKSTENLKFDPQTVMSLVSTINFRAKWQNEFSPSNTYEGVFHSTNGDTECEYLYKSETMENYCWGKNFSAVSLALTESGRMWFILPDEGTTPHELLNSDEVMNMLLSYSDYKKTAYPMIELSIPKFDISSDTDLTKKLKKVGVTDVFDFDKSDFSPLLEENGEIAITSARHSARVTIDEEGVTAAAFTTLDYAGASMPEDKVEFKLDRPFLFVITGQGNIPLFVGIVNQM